MEKGSKSLGRRLLLACLGILLGVGVYLANARGAAAKGLPMPFGYGAAVVLSGSMEPALNVNDLILIRATDDCQVGDIVVYQGASSLIVHRVIARDGETIVTQGDANNTPDAPIRRSDLRGEVVARIPGLGAAVNALRTPVGILAVLCAVFGLTQLAFRRERDQGDREVEAIREEIRQLKEQQGGKD